MQNPEELLQQKYPGGQLEGMVSELVAKYYGLLSRPAAMRVLARKEGLLREEPVKLADIRPDMQSVSFSATVSRIFPPLESKDGRKKSVRVFVADGTGELTLVLWNEQAKLLEGAIGLNDTVRVEGAYMRNGEIYVKYGGSLKAEKPAKLSEIGKLEGGLSSVAGRIGQVNLDYYFVRDGKECVMSSFTLEDETGQVRVAVWSAPEQVKGLFGGDRVKVENGLFKNSELHVNNYSRIVLLSRGEREDVVSGGVEGYSYSDGKIEARIDGKEIEFAGPMALLFLDAVNIPQDVSLETVAMLKEREMVGRKMNVKVKKEGGKLFALEIVR